LAGATLDVDTEKLRLFIRINQLEERYRTLVENANVGIYLLMEGRIAYANPEFQNMFGYSLSELSQMSITDLIHKDDRRSFIERMNGGDWIRCRGVRKDGSLMLLEWSIAPLRYHGGFAIQGTVKNLTQIEFLLTERERLYRELEKLYKEIQKSEDDKVKFLEMISHEIRTPLTIIYGYLDMIEKGQNSSIEKIEKYVEGIRNGADRIKEVLDKIVSIEMIEEVCEVKWRKVELSSLVKEVVESLTSSKRRKNVNIRCNLDKVIVECDAEKIKAAVRELLSNSMKFTFGGHIDVSVSKYDKWAIVSVRDTGSGIQDIERIFERLHIAHDIKKHSRGIGGGLYLAKRFAHMHGGEIEVESKPLKGSVFTLKLPL